MILKRCVSMAPVGKNKKSVVMRLECGHVVTGSVAVPVVDCPCCVESDLGFDAWFAEGDAISVDGSEAA